MDHKKRVMDALKRNHARLYKDQKKEGKAKKKYAKPEKQVEEEVMKWCTLNGFDMHVVEAKAVFNPHVGQYLRGQAAKGFPDMCGCDMYGHSAWIELKAPGRLSTLRPEQRSFLESKIEKNCFAVCVDKVEKLQQYYDRWVDMKMYQSDPAKCREYLYQCLPKKRKGSSAKENAECSDMSFLD